MPADTSLTNAVNAPSSPKKKGWTIDPATGQLIPTGTEAESPVPPSTPLGTASAGGSPAQAKMTGTPAQTAAAAPTTIPPPAAPAPAKAPGGDLLNSLRYEGKTGQAAAEAPALSSDAQRAARQSQTLSSATSGLTGLDALIQRKATAALSAKPKAGPSGRGAIVTPEGATVPVPPASATGEVAPPEEIPEGAAVTEAGAQLANALKGLKDYRLTADDLKSLGYGPARVQELQAAIGRSPIGMTADDLRTAVERAQSKIEAGTEAAQEAARDLSLGATARGAAAEQAMGLQQATGVDVRDLNDVIASAEEAGNIQFFGQSVPLKDILSNADNTELIRKYAEGDEATRADLKKQSPDLATWIDTNLPAIQESLQKKHDEQQKAYDAAQQKKQWESVAQSAPTFPKEAQKVLVDAASGGSEIAKAILSSPDGAMQNIGYFASRTPAFYQALLRGDFGDVNHLRDLGLFDSGTDEAKAKIGPLIGFAHEWDAIEDLSQRARAEGGMKPEDVVSALFPEGTTLSELQQQLNEIKAGGKAGDPRAAAALTLLDRDNNGKIDSNISPESLRKFREQLKGLAGTPTGVTQGLGDLAASVSPTSKVFAAQAADRTITSEERPAVISIIQNSDLPATALEQELAHVAMSDYDRGQINQVLARKAGSDALTTIQGIVPDVHTERLKYPASDPKVDAHDLVSDFGATYDDSLRNLTAAYNKVLNTISGLPKNSATNAVYGDIAHRLGAALLLAKSFVDTGYTGASVSNNPTPTVGTSGPRASGPETGLYKAAQGGFGTFHELSKLG